VHVTMRMCATHCIHICFQLIIACAHLSACQAKRACAQAAPRSHHAVPATGAKRAAARAQLSSPSGLAVLRLQPKAELSANLLLCLAPDALRTALVAHYANGALVGCGRPHRTMYRPATLLVHLQGASYATTFMLCPQAMSLCTPYSA